MKLMVIKSKNSQKKAPGIFTKLMKSKYYGDCSGAFAQEILKREKPDLVYTNLFKPVNGEDDVVTMLSSMDMNTRLRVIIFDTKSVNENLRDRSKNFVLPGEDQHNLETP